MPLNTDETTQLYLLLRRYRYTLEGQVGKTHHLAFRGDENGGLALTNHTCLRLSMRYQEYARAADTLIVRLENVFPAIGFPPLSDEQ